MTTLPPPINLDTKTDLDYLFKTLTEAANELSSSPNPILQRILENTTKGFMQNATVNGTPASEVKEIEQEKEKEYMECENEELRSKLAKTHVNAAQFALQITNKRKNTPNLIKNAANDILKRKKALYEKQSERLQKKYEEEVEQQNARGEKENIEELTKLLQWQKIKELTHQTYEVVMI